MQKTKHLILGGGMVAGYAGSSWRKSTTSSACIRRLAIVRRLSLSEAYDPGAPSGKDEHEFFEA